MKKLIALTLTGATILSLCACGKTEPTRSSTKRTTEETDIVETTDSTNPSRVTETGDKIHSDAKEGVYDLCDMSPEEIKDLCVSFTKIDEGTEISDYIKVFGVDPRGLDQGYEPAKIYPNFNWNTDFDHDYIYSVQFERCHLLNRDETAARFLVDSNVYITLSFTDEDRAEAVYNEFVEYLKNIPIDKFVLDPANVVETSEIEEDKDRYTYQTTVSYNPMYYPWGDKRYYFSDACNEHFDEELTAWYYTPTFRVTRTNAAFNHTVLICIPVLNSKLVQPDINPVAPKTTPVETTTEETFEVTIETTN